MLTFEIDNVIYPGKRLRTQYYWTRRFLYYFYNPTGQFVGKRVRVPDYPLLFHHRNEIVFVYEYFIRI